VTSICTGAYPLEEARLAERRSRATTMVNYARECRGFPEVRWEEDRIFIVAVPIWTSGRRRRWSRSCLALVRRKRFGGGSHFDRWPKKKLVMHHRSAGGGSPNHSGIIWNYGLSPKSTVSQNALSYARRHLGSSLSVDSWMKWPSLSPRHVQSGLSADKRGQLRPRRAETSPEGRTADDRQSHHPH